MPVEHGIGQRHYRKIHLLPERRARYDAIGVRCGEGLDLAADLAVLSRSSARHALDKLGYALVFLVLALIPAASFPLLGVAVPPPSARSPWRPCSS